MNLCELTKIHGVIYIYQSRSHRAAFGWFFLTRVLMPFKKVTQNRQFYYVGPEPQAFETLPDPSCTRYIAATLSHIALSLTRLARDGVEEGEEGAGQADHDDRHHAPAHQEAERNLRQADCRQCAATHET